MDEVPKHLQSYNYEPPKKKKESKLQREYREYKEGKEKSSKKSSEAPKKRNIAEFKRKIKQNSPLYPKKLMEEAIHREKKKGEMQKAHKHMKEHGG